MATVAEMMVEISANTTNLTRGINESNSALKKFASPEVMDFSKNLAFGLGALGTAMVGVAGKAVHMAAQMEQTEVAFGTLLGSGEEAQKFLSSLADFAAKTPFELIGLQQSSRRLLAFGFEAESIIPIMTSVGNAVSALGGGEEEINRINTALGQMQAKGKVSTEELMQMAEVGIPVFEILQEEMNMTGEQLATSLQKGAIEGQAGIEAILTGIDKRFEGSMEKQSKTILGVFSNIQDNVGQIMIRVGQDIIEGLNLAEVLSRVADFTDKIRSTVQEGGIKAVFTELIPPELIPKIVAIAGAIGGLLAPAFGSAILTGLRLIGIFTPLGLIGAAIALLALLIFQNWSMISTVLNEQVIPAVQNLINAFLNSFIVQAVIDFLVAQFMKIQQFWFENGPMIIEALRNVANFFVSAFNTILKIIDFVMPVVKVIIEAVMDSIFSIISSVIGLILNVIKFFAALFTGDWGALWDATLGILKNAGILLLNILLTFLGGGALKIAVKALGKLFKVFKGVFDDILKIIKDIMMNIGKNIDRSMNGIPSTILKIGGDLFKAGASIIGSLIRGITSKISEAGEAVGKVVSRIRDFLPSSPAKEGALRDLNRLDFSSPIIDSIQNDIPMIEAKLKALLSVPSVNIVEPFRMNMANVPMMEREEEREQQPQIIIQNMQVRSDEDIQRISERLFRLQQDKLRQRGVRV